MDCVLLVPLLYLVREYRVQYVSFSLRTIHLTNFQEYLGVTAMPFTCSASSYIQIWYSVRVAKLNFFVLWTLRIVWGIFSVFDVSEVRCAAIFTLTC